MKDLHLELIRCQYAGVCIGLYKVWEVATLAERVPTLHAHETYEIHIMTDGCYTFTVEGQPVPLAKRQLLVLKPGTAHYSYDRMTDGELISLHLSLEKTDNADGFYSYFRRALDNAANKPLTASRALVQCVSEFENEPDALTAGVYCRLQVLATQIVYHLFNDIDGFGGEQMCLKSSRRVHSREYLVECMVNEPTYTLEDISARTGYSMRHTTRIIQSMYGKTLTEIRTDRSMDRAKTLLVSTDKAVEEIATVAGFGSAAAMRRAFLKKENMSPSAYRCGGRKESEGE
jgi:AraC-like DNA-binding protein